MRVKGPPPRPVRAVVLSPREAAKHAGIILGSWAVDHSRGGPRTRLGSLRGHRRTPLLHDSPPGERSVPPLPSRRDHRNAARVAGEAGPPVACDRPPPALPLPPGGSRQGAPGPPPAPLHAPARNDPGLRGDAAATGDLARDRGRRGGPADAGAGWCSNGRAARASRHARRSQGEGQEDRRDRPAVADGERDQRRLPRARGAQGPLPGGGHRGVRRGRPDAGAEPRPRRPGRHRDRLGLRGQGGSDPRRTAARRRRQAL